MNHGNWLCCHVPNPAGQGLTALVCDYPRSSLLRSSAASDRGEGPALEDQPPGSAGLRAWRMKEDLSRPMQGMKTCCFTYQSQTLLLFPLFLSLSLSPLGLSVSSPLSDIHLNQVLTTSSLRTNSETPWRPDQRFFFLFFVFLSSVLMVSWWPHISVILKYLQKIEKEHEVMFVLSYLWVFTFCPRYKRFNECWLLVMWKQEYRLPCLLA